MQPLIDSAPTWVTPFLMTSIKATFVLALAGGLATIMRRAPAAVRHGIWTAGIVGAIAVPFVPRMLPTIEIQAPPSVVALFGDPARGTSPS